MQRLSRERVESRLKTLNDCIDQYGDRIRNDPNSPKAEAWQQRIDECRQSIDNIKTYRMESITAAERAELEAAQ